MAFPTRWPAIQAVTTSNGTTTGIVTIASVAGWYVFQQVGLVNAAKTKTLSCEIKRIVPPNTITLGFTNQPGFNAQDVSAFLAGSTLMAAEQTKAPVNGLDIYQAIFEQTPTSAIRTVGVDQYGNPLGQGIIPFSFDSLQVTSVDGSGNPLTIKYYKGGLAGSYLGNLTLTYDGSGNLATAAFAP
jgi:hypothetical protein